MSRLNYIKNNLDKTDEQLAQDLNISVSYVVAIRNANGLEKKAVWTEADDRWLLNNYSTASWQEIYDRFPDKTKPVVKTRAYQLKVYRAWSPKSKVNS